MGTSQPDCYSTRFFFLPKQKNIYVYVYILSILYTEKGFPCSDIRELNCTQCSAIQSLGNFLILYKVNVVFLAMT